MQQVSRFEAHLLHIVYGMMDESPPAQILPKVLETQKRPECLSRPAVELIQQALAKGLVRWLAAIDGWKQERFLDGDQVLSGPVWQRHDPQRMGLSFSTHTLDFLMHLAAGDGQSVWKPRPTRGELTIGDQLLLFRVCGRLAETNVVAAWVRRQPFSQNPLIALAFPDKLAARQNLPHIDYRWLTEKRAVWIIECLQSWLAARWIEIERGKRLIADAEKMVSLGRAQQAVLQNWLAVAVEAGRWDLCRFWLVALARLVVPAADLRAWIDGLDLSHLRLADRTRIYQSASVFLGFAKQLQSLTNTCRQIGYFDEGYAAAQLWLADWERYDGEQASARAAALVRSQSL